jgi:5-formyltetrahydrofolate cyclo-ligase
MVKSADQDSSSLEERKRELRRVMLSRRDGITLEVARAIGDLISEALAADDRYRKAHSLAVYAASGGEPDLQSLFELGVESGKRVLLPRCGEDRLLSFHAVGRWSELEVGRFGLLEPSPESQSVDVGVVDLLVVPCVAVDRSGGRLGRGGGWYDRSLSANRGRPGCVVAAVHEFQIVERVPRGSGDRIVDAIVTASGFDLITQ